MPRPQYCLLNTNTSAIVSTIYCLHCYFVSLLRYLLFPGCRVQRGRTLLGRLRLQQKHRLAAGLRRAWFDRSHQEYRARRQQL